MAEKRLNSRIIHKHDTETNWEKSSLVPMKGEIIVYDVDDTHTYERFKIGDGSTLVSALPFANYTHPTSGVTAGTYKSVTVNAQGHVTAGTNPTTLSGYGITDAVTKTELSSLVGDKEVSEQISEAIKNKSDTNHTHNYAGSSSVGGPANSVKTNLTVKLNGGSTEGTNLFTYNGSTAKTVNITPSAIGAAASSHGNHVPETETANNAKFLRNDNTWQTVTPANIGAAATNHGTHVSYSDSAPVMDGTASVGSASTVARSDHKHPTDTSRASASELDSLKGLVGDTAVSKQIGDAISVHTHSNYVNQNAFSSVVVGSTTIAADNATDTLTLVASDNITLTPDASGDKITIAAKDTVYTHPSYTARTGVPTADQTPAFGGAFNVSQPVSDSTGHITAINSRKITIPNATATVSAAGLMSAADKKKLDEIATGANKTTVDSALSSSSTNPVQNKAIYEALNDLVGDTPVSDQIEAAQIIYVGPTQPTDPNIKVWINTAEEGTGIVPVLPRVATISLPKANWAGSAAPYNQTVSINTVTSATKVELNPTVSQIVSLQNDDIALMAENNNGTVKVYSFGGKPSADMTMQVTLTEVSYV